MNPALTTSGKLNDSGPESPFQVICQQVDLLVVAVET